MELRTFPLILCVCTCALAVAKPIESVTLDDQRVHTIRVAPDHVTTVMFPGPLTALDGHGITTDPKVFAPVLLSYQEGQKFFSLRALDTNAVAQINVVWDGRAYALRIGVDASPNDVVTFLDPDELDVPTAASRASLGPPRLLQLLDRAKAYSLLASQHPETVADIQVARIEARSLYPGFDAEIFEVFRFEAEDCLVFHVRFFNRTQNLIFYKPQGLAVRIGGKVFPSALSDATGIIPAAATNGALIATSAFFAVAGDGEGGRNNLSPHNRFNLLVPRLGTPPEIGK